MTSLKYSLGTLCYKVIPFGQDNTGAPSQRTVTVLFYDMIHEEMNVVDDIIYQQI